MMILRQSIVVPHYLGWRYSDAGGLKFMVKSLELNQLKVVVFPGQRLGNERSVTGTRNKKFHGGAIWYLLLLQKFS